MRKYLHINLADQSVKSEDLSGEALARAGRYLIAKTLTDKNLAGIDPLSPENPLIFSAGPFAGTNFSNANRISVGCKSPLTGGIKESNAGGNFAFAMGQLEIAGFTLEGASDDWVVIRIPKEGDITFEPADEYLGLGLFDTAEKLYEKYGTKVCLSICSPVGEYGGLIGGIAFSDPEGRPVRISARGGVGAVMGSKKVKAIIADQVKMPTFHDRKSLMGKIRKYTQMLGEDPAVENMSLRGTAMVADITNLTGGLPVNNFSVGRLVDTDVETMKMGGDFIREQNLERGGDTTHACMPGCMIQCSNIYVDKDGKEIVSPLEYETIGLLGTNCGLKEPDELAYLNATANDLGIDTIEVGALLAVMMECGEGEFGDVDFMAAALEDIRQGSERGKLLAQGTARVGEHYGAKRVPVIKKQAISAYDPRVVEVTGISMMTTAQGADHTTGNLPAYTGRDDNVEELVELSMDAQVNCAAGDSLGLCVFGRSVTNVNHPMIVEALNDALGTNLGNDFLRQLGRETLALEDRFNEDAGFNEADDELPAFFYDEALPPTNNQARHHAAEVNRLKEAWLARPEA
ncbi:MAG: aldehyde ferredoxin oxidoreductase [Rhodospirillaceae bacterium]|nr:aldehyde ferredoxin oxidoreductase [Rhodospirillaceae bacterium]